MPTRTAGLIALALAVGFTLGTLAGAAVLIGPGGFRPPTATVAQRTPSIFPTPEGSATPLAVAPTPRSYAAMAFDAAIGEMVLFGGFEAVTWRALGDTWTWNGKRWQLKLHRASDPLPRVSATMAYDAAHKVIVMRGGIDNAMQFLDETWTWDGTSWKKMAPAQSPPVFVGALEPMVWDAKLNRVLLFAMTKDPYTQYDVPPLNQLWTWDGSNWTVLNASGAPKGHESLDATMAYYPTRQQVVFFAHVGSGNPATWAFDQSSWNRVSGTGPTMIGMAVDGRQVANDDARNSLVMLDSSENTWTWDGSQWNLTGPAHVPTGHARAGAAIAYDAVRRVAVLFGGGEGTGRTAEFNDTWTWNGSDWARVG